jgi:hypothetical protein
MIVELYLTAADYKRSYSKEFLLARTQNTPVNKPYEILELLLSPRIVSSK